MEGDENSLEQDHEYHEDQEAYVGDPPYQYEETPDEGFTGYDDDTKDHHNDDIVKQYFSKILPAKDYQCERY